MDLTVVQLHFFGEKKKSPITNDIRVTLLGTSVEPNGTQQNSDLPMQEFLAIKSLQLIVLSPHCGETCTCPAEGIVPDF